MPTDKGRVEKRIQDYFCRLDIKHKIYDSFKHLQKDGDAKLHYLEYEWRCAATGNTVEKSFLYEQKMLKQLPKYFPILPLAEKKCIVGSDGIVNFKNNSYQVHGSLRGQKVLCEHMGNEIILYHEGEEIERYEYLPQARGMVRLSKKVLQDEELKISDRVRNWGIEVAERQVAIYYEIMQGGEQ